MIPRTCLPALLLSATLMTLPAGARAQMPPIEWMPLEHRQIDGAANNPVQPQWGRAATPLRRATMACYLDGIGIPVAGPSARVVSNIVVAQPGPRPSLGGASDFVWQWGQFIDHDMDLSTQASDELFPIPVPAGDPWFDPDGTGTAVIPLSRSRFVMDGSRQQMNMLTSFIDASNVYGSDPTRAMELRALDGTGRLRTSPGDLLPFNVNGFDDVPETFFIAGDVRANEQIGLTAMHTLFVREHNYWAGHFAAQDPQASDETLFTLARAMVGAEMQVITYREFLPRLLGPRAPGRCRGYDPTVDPRIMNEFSTAAFRIGHSLLSPQLQRLDAGLASIPAGPLPLRNAFFAPQEIIDGGGIEPLLRGLARQTAQEVDPFVVDDVRNFLFGAPGTGGFDLPSLNIQRGRDHGMPRYNEARRLFGLPAKTSFAGVSSNPEIRSRLAAAYESVDDVDLWIGALAEDHVRGALVGELTATILVRQFEALRDGDRFWYESLFPQPMIAFLETQTLATILRRNTSIGDEIQDDLFTSPCNPAFAVSDPDSAGGTGSMGGAAPDLDFGMAGLNPVPATQSALFRICSRGAALVSLTVYDVQGRPVRRLDTPTEPGHVHLVEWNGHGTDGRRKSGVFFVRALSERTSGTVRVVLAD